MIYDWLQHISFAYPVFFTLFAIVPLLIFWYVKRGRQRNATVIVSSLKTHAEFLSWKNILRHLMFVFRLIAISCLILALARPQFKNEQQQTNGEGIDIVLCLDISGSMLAQDFTPNRMEAAKNVASEFIDARPTDRIGLVIFSGESFTMCPLTTDRSVLKSQLFNVQSGLLEDGTAIGSGLATSIERLRSTPSKSKVIILLTDGENNGGLIDPNTAKEIAKSVGVRVYTVGMGTEGFAPVPVQTPAGVVMQREKVSIDEKLLTQIANETGGKYFRAKDNESLSAIYKEIDKLEKSKIEITTSTKYSEQFFPFALIAAGLLALELILQYTIFRKYP
ncbi:MAG: aerotolerance regulator BatA [Bacteroidetes bacterium]|nr:MAG: aerotolerance regulator BatA [Bacteroidota bacterium]